MYEALIARLKQNEGFRETVYLDHLGNPTIGYGFLVSHLRLDEAVSDIILRQIVDKIIASVKVKYPWYSEMPHPVKSVIVEMCYQMGMSGFSKFKRTQKLMQAKDFRGAAASIRASKWHSQTPARCERLARIVEDEHGK